MIESKKMDALIDFVRYYAACPCCGEEVECSDGCTFEHDDVAAHEVMIEARLALSQPVQPATDTAQRAEFDAWCEEFSSTHEEWKYADSSALRWAAWQAAQETQPVPLDHVERELLSAHTQNSEAVDGGWKSSQPVQPETQEAAFAPVKVEDTKDAFFRAGWGQNEVIDKMINKKQAMKLEADHPARPINCGTGHCSCIECVMDHPWQELSSDEIAQIVENPHILPHTFAVAISKALREKNERPTK